jgi:hypothetical protein
MLVNYLEANAGLPTLCAGVGESHEWELQSAFHATGRGIRRYQQCYFSGLAKPLETSPFALLPAQQCSR